MKFGDSLTCTLIPKLDVFLCIVVNKRKKDEHIALDESPEVFGGLLIKCHQTLEKKIRKQESKCVRLELVWGSISRKLQELKQNRSSGLIQSHSEEQPVRCYT